MAVSLASDIVLDVANAADPAAMEEARQRLLSRGVTAPSTSFASIVAGQSAPLAASRKPDGSPAAPPVSEPAAPTRDLEAMVLRNLFDALLPQGTTLGGAGFAGDMWESTLIDKIAEAGAKRGDLGIASRLLADTVLEGDDAVAISGARDVRQIVRAGAGSDLASAFVANMQRAALTTIDGTSSGRGGGRG